MEVVAREPDSTRIPAVARFPRMGRRIGGLTAAAILLRRTSVLRWAMKPIRMALALRDRGTCDAKHG